jgi:hypothetical protein
VRDTMTEQEEVRLEAENADFRAQPAARDEEIGRLLKAVYVAHDCAACIRGHIVDRSLAQIDRRAAKILDATQSHWDAARRAIEREK